MSRKRTGRGVTTEMDQVASQIETILGEEEPLTRREILERLRVAGTYIPSERHLEYVGRILRTYSGRFDKVGVETWRRRRPHAKT